MVDDTRVPTKRSFGEWLGDYLPFKLPTIPLPRTRKNLDKAAARLVMASIGNLSVRIEADNRRRRSRSHAEEALIKRSEAILKDLSIDQQGVDERAMQHALGEALHGQTNRDRILELASEEFANEAPGGDDASADIDDDWLNKFSRHASEKSNEDVQRIWAKILASEIRRPGSSSLRTLEFLSLVDAHEAKRIVAAFSYVVEGAYIPRFADQRLGVSELVFLDEIGVIAGQLTYAGLERNIGTEAIDKFEYGMCYFQQVAIFRGPDSQHKLKIPMHPLTDVGAQLCRLSNTIAPNPKFFEDFCLSLSKEKIASISIANIKSISGNSVEFQGERTIYKQPS